MSPRLLARERLDCCCRWGSPAAEAAGGMDRIHATDAADIDRGAVGLVCRFGLSPRRHLIGGADHGGCRAYGPAGRDRYDMIRHISGNCR